MNSKPFFSQDELHTLTQILLQIVKTSELTKQWQQMLDGDAAPRQT